MISSIPKKHKWFGIKSTSYVISNGYTYNMLMYLGRDRKHVTATMTTVHATVSGLTIRIRNFGHELCMDSFFLLIYLLIYIQKP
jgi:hypothetical protein